MPSSSLVVSNNRVLLPGLSFELDPIQGPVLKDWRFKPFSQWGQQEEAIKTVSTNAAVGGGITYIGMKVWSKVLSFIPETTGVAKTLDKLTYAATITATIAGAIKGVIDTRQYFLERTEVIHTTVASAKKAQSIITAFVEKNLGTATLVEEIICPISYQVMVYPVTVKCNKTDDQNIKGHIFDYFSIIGSIGKQRDRVCPLCKQSVKIEDLTLVSEKEQQIKEAVGNIFRKLEAILARLPKKWHNEMPNFDDSQLTSRLFKVLQEGKNFLAEDEDTIIKKISRPDDLTDAELVGLGYYIVHQFKPLKGKIDQIYRVAGDYLKMLRTDTYITPEAYKAQSAQLDQWYDHFNIIPADCRIINELYHA